MKIIISNNSEITIYEQIKTEIINQILSEELQENDPLPSIRSLAQDIRISIMTIKKAYDELEEEGYIVTKQGKGSFIAPKNIELLKEQKQKEMEEYLEKAIIISKSILNKEQLLEIINYLYEEDSK